MTQINGFGANGQEFDYPTLVANIRLEVGLRSDIDRHQPQHSQIQEHQAQMNGLKVENLDLKTENFDLKTENSNLRRINQELQWRIDPNSPDGDAICNSDWQLKIQQVCSPGLKSQGCFFNKITGIQWASQKILLSLYTSRPHIQCKLSNILTFNPKSESCCIFVVC